MSILKDGFSTTAILFGVASNLFGEVEVTPPEVDARGGIDMTSMRNTAWITMLPKKLKQLNAATARVQFDLKMYNRAFTLIGKNNPQEIHFPDGGVLVFWGWWDKWTPEGMSESNKPISSISIMPSNLNNQCLEVPPTYLAGGEDGCP